MAQKHGGRGTDTPGPTDTTSTLTVPQRYDRLPSLRILMSVRSDEYAAGFADGWADRAEYERRRHELGDERLTFDDGVRIGRELGAGPAPEQADEDAA